MFRFNQEKILKLIKQNPYVSQQELAEATGLSRSTVANLISDLVDKGFLLGRAYIVNESLAQKVLCIGGANVDIKSVLSQEFMMHTSNPADSTTSMGGVVRNISENLARLSVDTGLLTALGNDPEGQVVLERMGDLLDVSHVALISDYTTGKYHAILDKNGDLVCGLSNMEVMEKITVQWLSDKVAYMNRFDFWVVDNNLSKEVLAYLFSLAKTFDKKLVMIGVSSPKIERLPLDLTGVYLSIFNLDESQTRFNSDTTDIQWLANQWIKQGTKHVIVTSGSQPVCYANQKESAQFKVHKVEHVVDATGAGDAFSAGVIYGVMKNYDISRAISYGLANAALTIKSNQSVRQDLTINLLEEEVENYE